MVQVVVLSANGEQRTMKTTAFEPETVSGITVAKALRKTKPAELVASYTFKDQPISLWGWKEGKAGTENKHELPSSNIQLYGDIMVTGADNFTGEEWSAFYEDAFGETENLDSDHEDEDEAEEVEEAEEAEEAEEEEEAEEDAEEAEEAEEAEAEEEEDADEDCYDDGDEHGGGKRRAPRRRATTAPEYRRMDMGLKSRIKLPMPLGKRAPRWQTAPELMPEEYD